MHNLGFALDGAWRVLLAGLLLGAGLPILFAVGIRTLSWTATTGSGVSAPSPLGRTLAYTLFGVVILGVALGITFIVASGFGKALSFEHLYPTIVDKH